MTLIDKLDLFFENPNKRLANAGVVDTNPNFPTLHCKKLSSLCLLRKDVRRCFRQSDQILWPGTMAVLAGIDLLAKLHDGNDTNGAIGQRFRNFVNAFMLAGDGARVWALRNALLHSYGIYFEDATATPARFRLNSTIPLPTGSPSLFQTPMPNIVDLNVRELRTCFENSISSYETHIRGSAADQTARFEPMFDKYGWIWLCEFTAAGGPTSTIVDIASGG